MRLLRWGSTPHGTFGELHLECGWSCFTLERPWVNNKPFISCIPAGKYELKELKYNHGGYDALGLMAVPNRTHILIHIGNTDEECAGCILVGSSLSMLGHRWAVSNSRTTFNNLMEKSEPELEIEIVWQVAEG